MYENIPTPKISQTTVYQFVPYLYASDICVHYLAQMYWLFQYSRFKLSPEGQHRLHWTCCSRVVEENSWHHWNWTPLLIGDSQIVGEQGKVVAATAKWATKGERQQAEFLGNVYVWICQIPVADIIQNLQMENEVLREELKEAHCESQKLEKSNKLQHQLHDLKQSV